MRLFLKTYQMWIAVLAIWGCTMTDEAFVGPGQGDSANDMGESEGEGVADTGLDGEDANKNVETHTDVETDDVETDAHAGMDTHAGTDSDEIDSDTSLAEADCTVLLAQFSPQMLLVAEDQNTLYFMGASDREQTIVGTSESGAPIVEYGPWLAELVKVRRADGLQTTVWIETPKKVTTLLKDGETFYVYDQMRSQILYPISTSTGQVNGDAVSIPSSGKKYELVDGQLFGIWDGTLKSFDLETQAFLELSSDEVQNYHVSADGLFWEAEETAEQPKRIMRLLNGEDKTMQLASGDLDEVRFSNDHIVFLTAGGQVFGAELFSAIPEPGEGWMWMEKEGFHLPSLVNTGDIDVQEEDAIDIFGDVAYLNNAEGELWRIPLAENGKVVLLGKQGRFDDDDFMPFVQVIDENIYWRGGLDPDLRASDDDDIGLFKTCMDVPMDPNRIDFDAFWGNTVTFSVTRRAETVFDEPVPNELFVGVDGPDYGVTFSDDGSMVSVMGNDADAGLVGYLLEKEAEKIVYELKEGTVAGGRLAIEAGEEGLVGELILYGSGVPIIKAEQGVVSNP